MIVGPRAKAPAAPAAVFKKRRRPTDFTFGFIASRSSGAPTDAIDQIVEQQGSEVQVRVFEATITSHDLAIGN